MKRSVTQLTANTLLEALGHAQNWMKENAPSDVCWFRGVKDSDLPLMPGAYWRADYNELAALLEFSQEGRAFADIGEVDDWKTYYFAQHSGIPTRLLDWTENFITAQILEWVAADAEVGFQRVALVPKSPCDRPGTGGFAVVIGSGPVRAVSRLSRSRTASASLD